ncbi:MAG: GAF domain-containing sensor histidine kinase [Phototrophicales bacterium]|nr:GAF domain-containing sensor histidine kinase [Phototrophicales bacterium]
MNEDKLKTTETPAGKAMLLAHYERIIEISKQLNSTFDQRSLLQQIVVAAADLIDTEAASIMLIDTMTGELRFETATNIDPNEMESIIIPMDGSIAGWIATHGEPRVIQDVANEPEHFPTVDETIEFQTRNLLGVPVRTHKKIIGVVMCVNKRNDMPFTSVDVNILTTLSAQAAIAIENARLFRQSDFIAEMVHELRTPLLSLKASTAILLRPDMPEHRRHDIIVTMQGETDRLMRLTTDFLDLAQMESGRTRIQLSQFELRKLLEESAAVVSPQANEKGVTIAVNCEEHTINGDRGKIKQVLLNLLTNAIKYNRPDGTVTLRVIPNNDYQTPMLQIELEDTGYGLSKENQKQMFQKFFRAQSTADTTTGTGLGLVITKAIIEAHGGQIWLDSEEGVGTTFYFTLPMMQ